jgi:hypothetical protein
LACTRLFSVCCCFVTNSVYCKDHWVATKLIRNPMKLTRETPLRSAQNCNSGPKRPKTCLLGRTPVWCPAPVLSPRKPRGFSGA